MDPVDRLAEALKQCRIAQEELNDGHLSGTIGRLEEDLHRQKNRQGGNDV